MRKIDKLVLQAFMGPFFLTLVVVIFIFLLRLLLFYFSDLFGKDLGIEVYIQLFFYFSLITLPLAFPLATLMSSLMTFGKLGENFELTALKSAGISIFRVFRPIIILALGMSVFMFWFTNIALPWANLKGWSLLYDIKTTKTTLNIKEGIFYTDLPGYTIQVSKKYPDNKTLKHIVIYDHTLNDGNRHLTIADSAKMYTILNKKYLVFELFNGKDYLEDADRGSNLDQSDVAIHQFKKSKVIMSLDAFDLQKTDESQFAKNQIMRNNVELMHDEDSLKTVIEGIKKSYISSYNVYYLYFRKDPSIALKALKYNTKWVKARVKSLEKGIINLSKVRSEAIQSAQNLISYGSSNKIAIDSQNLELKKTKLEWHHKFTNSLAILVMFLIGAPLGAIIKKGGFGVPIVVAVSFFILMYILTQQGEKMAKEGKLILQMGAWLSNTILGLIGIYFMQIALKDSRLFEWDVYKMHWDNFKSRLTKRFAFSQKK